MINVEQSREQAPTKTSYEKIIDLETRVVQMDGHKLISYEVDGERGFNLVKGVELPLNDGLSVSITMAVKTYDQPINDGEWVSLQGMHTVRGVTFRTSPRTEIRACYPLIDSGVRWVNIGGVRFTVTPEDFSLVADKPPVQLQIGSVSSSSRPDNFSYLRLGLPEQRTVLDWIGASIDQRRLGESSVQVSFLPQGQKPNS